ncbi:MAG: hypothetical protein JHC76_10130 [Akkermansiaceae bacterium]|nr:hypothetical protein [Akkermansiaceae bacterium]
MLRSRHKNELGIAGPALDFLAHLDFLRFLGRTFIQPIWDGCRRDANSP